MNIEDIQNKVVNVYNYQATFLTLEIDGQLFRFDLIDKKEFKLKKGVYGQFSFHETHPLLIDNNENILTTYINSKPDNFDDFIADFENAINEATQGWRNWTNYVEDNNINFTPYTFLNNVKSDKRKLLEAPFSITQKVIEVCAKHNVATKTFEDKFKRENYK